MPCCRMAARCNGNEKEESPVEKPKVHKVTLRRRETVQQPEEPGQAAGSAGNRVCKILNEWK